MAQAAPSVASEDAHVLSPHFEQRRLSDLQVTPTGGRRMRLADALVQAPALPVGQGPGTVAAGDDARIEALPLAFVVPGKPQVDQVLSLTIVTPCSLPRGLAGTRVFCQTAATAEAVFALRQRYAGGATMILGSIRFPAYSATFPDPFTQAALYCEGGATFAPGDVLQLCMPADADATLADLGITILAAKLPNPPGGGGP